MSNNNFDLEMELDRETIEEFMDSVQDNTQIIAQGFTALENCPDDTEIINQVFRSLHVIKGNACMCQIEHLTQFAHAMENIFSDIRNGTTPFTPPIGKAILVSLNKFKEHCDDTFFGSYTPASEIPIIKLLESLQKASPQEINPIVVDLYKTCDVDYEETNTVLKENITSSPCDNERNADLMFFKSLIEKLELKFTNWQGRTSHTLMLAQDVNKALGHLVDSQQLEMAIYTHDLGLAFLPDSLILSPSKYTEKEQDLMSTHPTLSSELLLRMSGWEEATLIVAQHHEKYDGTGYPSGIAGIEICPGARILAVVDAYESMTRPRTDRPNKQSVIKALSEINALSGTQFCPKVVSVFNNVIRQHVTKE